MRIGVVTHYMPPHVGGIELVAESLFRAYRASGFEVRWLAAREPATEPAREDGRIRVSCWNVLESKLGVPWPILGIEGMREVNRLVRWADLLHVHDCLYQASGASVLLARRARKPVILSQHVGFIEYQSAVLNGTEALANRTLGRLVLRSATHVVFCTKTAEQFAGPVLNAGTASHSFIPNGIDTDLFKPPTTPERLGERKKLNIPESARVALFVGRLVEKKGVDVLVELIRTMRSHLFVVVGDGPMRNLLPTDAANVVAFQAVEPEAIASLYRAADVFLLPSHGEGMPLSVQEAMASGLPVIVSRDEVFTRSLEPETACLAAERTAAGFQRSLERLEQDHELSSSLAARSRELAVRDWNVDVMTARYKALICKLAGTERADD